MRRYLELAVVLWAVLLAAISLLIWLPRLGTGWDQLGPDDGVIFAQNYDATPRDLRSFVLQSRRSRRIFAIPLNDCISLSEDGQVLVAVRDSTMQAVGYNVWERSRLNAFAVVGRASLCPHMVESADTVTFFGGNSQTDRYQISTGELFELPPITLAASFPREIIPPRDIIPTVLDPSEQYVFYARCLGDRPVTGCDDDWAYVIYDQQQDAIITTLPDADHNRLGFFGRLHYPALWSPNGRYLLYPAVPPSNAQNTTTEVRLYDLQTDTTTVLVSPVDGYLLRPQWSPNSAHLQMIVDQDVLSGSLFGDDARLAVYNVVAQTWAVSAGTYDILGEVRWSPHSDGVLLVTADITGETAGLLVHMNASTGQITMLAHNVTHLYSWFVTPP
jgi:hypothetical protein